MMSWLSTSTSAAPGNSAPAASGPSGTSWKVGPWTCMMRDTRRRMAPVSSEGKVS